jgi:sigma-B regulation protein RsbU (phosphoserine phosphatase)
MNVLRSFFRELSRFQRITLLILAVLMTVVVAMRFARGESTAGTFRVLLLWVVVLALAVFLRRALWRVRNRLLLTFFLFGVVPITLIGLMLIFTGELLFGQIAADRVREQLDRRTEEVSGAARELAVARPEAVAGLLSDLRGRIPGLRALIHTGDRTTAFPSDAELRAIPVWAEPGFKGLFETGSGRFLGARAADVFTYFPLDQQALTSLTPGIAILSVVSGVPKINVHLGNRTAVYGPELVRVGFGSTIYVTNKTAESLQVDSFQSEKLPAPRGFWDAEIGWLLSWPMRKSSGETDSVLFTFVSRPSLLFGRFERNDIVSTFEIALTLLAGFLLLVDLGALGGSLRHTRTITRSIHELYEGTRQIAAGNLAHRTPVHGKDQLSDLAASFNGMTEQIQKLIIEVREKEKLEAELEIAREVQLQLFPKTVPKLKTLELAGLCIPSRFVSGDYYDFVPLDDRWTALGLGDISGKGISAALLMASVQSALHAQLKFAGSMRAASSNGDLSVATLMARLSQQLYESTPAAKYATFFCSVYDDHTGDLLYTNAGHLPPILIREGKASPLKGDGMVVGLFPNVAFEQQTVRLQKGDLLAVFSDGIPEAENEAGDQFGEERLSAMLIENVDKTLDEIIRLVTNEVTEWAHDPEARDDATILLARRI